MIHNSFDTYSTAENQNISASYTQNESWISLKSLKQVMRISAEKDIDRYHSLRNSQ
jgi:hypothetical protein